MNYHEVRIVSRRLRKNQTPSEQLLWKQIRNRQLDGFKFLRQHPIIYDRNENDLNVFIPDFYCPLARLAIELDGGIHIMTRDHDLWREEILKSMQIKVLRIDNEELIDMKTVVHKIRLMLGTPPCVGRGRGGFSQTL